MTEVRIPSLKVVQPIGEFYLGVMCWKDLVAVSSADLRHLDHELDRYVGIQRKLNPDRVKDIGKFVDSVDATFPSSVVLAVRGECAYYDDVERCLVLMPAINVDTGERIPLEDVARILDGQHRVAGLRNFSKDTFDVPVSIFVDADISDQAYVFATVNLAQTKVNKSLVYDLLDYAKARSPQKSCHDVAVALDQLRDSPFHQLIKRLGTATAGRRGETLAQATVVGALLPYISRSPEDDRYALAKGRAVVAQANEYSATPFRHIWADGQDDVIVMILLEYFSAVRDRWPAAWASRQKGDILPRTNGFRAFMRFLKNVYLRERPEPTMLNAIVDRSEYKPILDRVRISDSDFNSVRFLPGTSGETALHNALRSDTGY